MNEDEEETLDRKLARLKREIEEARIELAEKDEDRELFSDAPENRPEEDGEEHTLESISKLNEALDAVYTARNGTSEGPAADLTQVITKFNGIESSLSLVQAYTSTIPSLTTTTPEHQAQLSQALAKAAEFDSRLSFLEQALGLAGDGTSEQDSDAPKPILHTLSTLDRQIQTLTNSSTSVDAASGKTRKLIEQAEHLLKVKSEYNALNHPTIEDTENVSKINALYGTLATIDSLSPTLPTVLARLRTLRLLHTSAAGAGSTLDEIEKRQAEQASEIKQWKDALTQVEKNLRSSEGGLIENVKSVEGWVKDLDARMARLS
jgi:nuclear migration protein JNM1